MSFTALPPKRFVSEAECTVAGFLAAVLWGQLLAVWVLDDFSPAAIVVATVESGVKVIRGVIHDRSLAGVSRLECLGGIFCGIAMLNMILGVEAILRRVGRTGFLRGRAFWWWTLVHGVVGVGIIVSVLFSLEILAYNLGQYFRLAAFLFAEVLVASYALRHACLSAPERVEAED
jgi:hypothetical protein